MRVALLTPEIATSYGWARYALELAQALSEQGVDVVALTQQTPAESYPWLADVRPVLPCLVPPPRGFLLRSLVAVPRVRQALKDCALVHVVAEPYVLLADSARGERPCVVTAHGTYVPLTVRRTLIGSVYRRAYRRSHIIAVSDFTAQQVRTVLPGIPVTVIRNGVHYARFQQPAPVPEKHGPTILASGGVKGRKGTHLLVAALAQVRERVPTVQLVVTGRQDDPQYLAQIRDQIAELGLADQVQLVGQLSEEALRGWYQHCDVFSVPSLSLGEQFEGFGLVFLEASASGRPVVGTRGSGVEEAVIDGQTGLLVPQNDVTALADALLRLLKDESLRAEMGAAGQVYAQSQDWSIVAARVRDYYENMLTRHN